MIKRKGDVFTTEARWIGHGVNCSGVMGAGIALPIKNKYPVNFKAYKEACDMEELAPGHCLVGPDEGVEPRIVNLATQLYPGPDARYSAIFESCRTAAEYIVNYEKHDRNPVLAIPMIGCGIGGLDWDKVECILRAVEILVPGFQFEVWKYE